MKKLLCLAAALSALAALVLLIVRPGEPICSDNVQYADYDINAPVIEFTADTENENGVREYYLFDDNPEHLNPAFLADGDSPSSIAHFDNLSPGIYTVFSYHHRGNSVNPEEDLYFDAVFSSDNSGSFKIISMGLDHDWDWNQVWADYSGTPVSAHEYFKTYSCTCPDWHDHEQETCTHPDCPAIVRDEIKYPRTDEIGIPDYINTVKKGTPLFLSSCVPWIKENDVNHFRYIGYNEPMWLYMTFEITSGTVTFDTVAYTSESKARENFSSMAKGAYDNEPQYKGIAYNAPFVSCEAYFNIDDNTPCGAIPVTVKNMRNPAGYTIADGTFATFVNTWREEQPIAAESDLMLLSYEDDNKLQLYGKNVTERSNIWHFDSYHTKCFAENRENKKYMISAGIPRGKNFIPNLEMGAVNYPRGEEVCDNDFYKYTACNLGNFGVTEQYILHVSNHGSRRRKFGFTMKSVAGQVYRFRQLSSDKSVIVDDGGTYIMKRFDSDPRENPESKAEPKERFEAAEYGETVSFDILPGDDNTIIIEVTTLTGCIAPMHSTFYVDY